MRLMLLTIYALILLFLLSSCSLISVNTCSKDVDTSEFIDVHGVSDFAGCQTICDGKDRNAYGATLYSAGKEPEFNCSCGPLRH